MQNNLLHEWSGGTYGNHIHVIDYSNLFLDRLINLLAPLIHEQWWSPFRVSIFK